MRLTEEADRAMIRFALSQVQEKTCVLFLEHESPNYIYVDNVEDKGCYSFVGDLKQGRQDLNLASGCMSLSTIKHEFLHALGFFHQQNSADRDDYVTVNVKNVKEEHENNFVKYSNSEVTNWGQGYDLGSVMHYAANDFSDNGQPVITSKKFKLPEDMGMVDDLSRFDIAKINRMYNCPK